MINKKGFTLVELLAVIVILAVILAIAIPSISNVISASTKSSFESDAKMLLKQVEYQKSIDNSFDSTTFDFTTLANYNLSNTNYSYLKVGIVNGESNILVIGKNKWDGLVACGTGKEINVAKYGNSISCNIPFDFSYTGNYQTFETPLTGNYKIELWGAEGGYGSTTYPSNQNTNGGIFKGGRSAYASGVITLTEGEKLYFYVGGKGVDHQKANNITVFGGYNGGGSGGYDDVNADTFGGGGGGATDVRIVSGAWNNFNSLISRIMIASGGGGGSTVNSTYSYNDAIRCGTATMGGALSINGTISSYTLNWVTINNVTQTTGNEFGIGGNGVNGNEPGGGGGGGYYGGTITTNTRSQAGAGGSSFISGYSGCNAVDETGVHTGQPNHYSGKTFTNSQMIDGNTSMPAPNGGTETGHTGNGYARITYIGQ